MNLRGLLGCWEWSWTLRGGLRAALPRGPGLLGGDPHAALPRPGLSETLAPLRLVVIITLFLVVVALVVLVTEVGAVMLRSYLRRVGACESAWTVSRCGVAVAASYLLLLRAGQVAYLACCLMLHACLQCSLD